MSKGKNSVDSASTGAAPKKVKDAPMKCADELTRKFIEAFLKQKKTKKEQATGSATGMSGHGWDAITTAMNKVAPLGTVYIKEKLQNRMPTLVKDYKSNEFLAKKTGLGIDAVTGAFTGSAEVMKEAGDTDKNYLKFFNRPLCNYDLLDELLRGKHATDQHASSSTSSGYQGGGDDDDDDESGVDFFDAVNKGKNSKANSNAKGKGSSKKKTDNDDDDDEEEQEEEKEEEEEEEGEGEGEKNHQSNGKKGGEEEDQQGEEYEKEALDDDNGVIAGDVDSVDMVNTSGETGSSTNRLKDRLLKRSRENAAEAPSSVSKKSKKDQPQKSQGLSSAASSTTNTNSIKGSGNGYDGRVRDTKKNAAAFALNHLAETMKNPVLVASEIVDNDAKAYKYTSRECYKLKQLLGDKSKATVFIGLKEEEREFWYDENGFKANE